MSFVVYQQIRVLKGQHFGFGKAEDCFDKLLNHRPLLHTEDFGTLAERLKDTISAVIAHSESDENLICGMTFFDQILVNDTLDVLVDVSSVPSLNHGLCFIFWLIINEVFALCGRRRG